jgi:hypothetical protein
MVTMGVIGLSVGDGEAVGVTEGVRVGDRVGLGVQVFVGSGVLVGVGSTSVYHAKADTPPACSAVMRCRLAWAWGGMRKRTANVPSGRHSIGLSPSISVASNRNRSGWCGMKKYPVTSVWLLLPATPWSGFNSI